MESDYGRYFLSNYQHAPIPASASKPRADASLVTAGVAPSSERRQEVTQTTEVTPAADGSGPEVPAKAGLTPLPKPSSTNEAPRTMSTGSTGTPAGLFRLAPPPTPVAAMAVGSTTPAEKVVKIDTLMEAHAVERKKTDEEFFGTGAQYVDDEESLMDPGGDLQEKSAERPARATVNFAGATLPAVFSAATRAPR
ncbi:unnamed protein product, partial [Polarella glacialis]